MNLLRWSSRVMPQLGVSLRAAGRGKQATPAGGLSYKPTRTPAAPARAAGDHNRATIHCLNASGREVDTADPDHAVADAVNEELRAAITRLAHDLGPHVESTACRSGRPTAGGAATGADTAGIPPLSPLRAVCGPDAVVEPPPGEQLSGEPRWVEAQGRTSFIPDAGDLRRRALRPVLAAFAPYRGVKASMAQLRAVRGQQLGAGRR
ncbi:hypothetical protein ACFQ9Z_18290 [Streptomyces sp. NPDC056580]|uniref:hypothetical protein n=1 Tax=Streptomyces sp. NPDC056580 TaxID=3345872 RepID=UPI003687CE29